MPNNYAATNPKKFLDADGLAHFAQKLNQYPTNEVISAVIDGVQDALDEKINLTEKGAVNGVATLDQNGKVPVAQIPGSITDTTYTLTQDSADGHIITLTPSTGTATTITIPDNNTTYSTATESANGLMSSEDKTKLDGIAEGATANVGTITGITMNGASKGTSGVVNLGTVLTAHQDISGKADKSEVPTKVSQLTNDSGFTSNVGTITGIKMNGASKGTSGVVDLGTVITAHQDVSGKADKSEIPTKVSQLTNDSGFTSNTGTITGIKMNGASKGTSGVVDLGTVITAHQDISGKLNTSLKGAANGLAELDENGKVPSSQLPSYVDDVLEFAKKDNFPLTGEAGKIYVNLADNKTYRWGGSEYVEISPSLALGTTSSTAFRGDYGNAAYTHASAKGSAYTSGLYKITTNSEGHVTNATTVTKGDITALGIPAQDTTYTFDGTYNASTNKAATVATVKNAINALDGGEIGAGGVCKTITSLSQENGNVSATFENISITKSQVSDLGTIGAAAAKGVDSSISAGSTSTNLPTSQAVASFVEGKGYKTTDNNTTYTISQDETDGHKFTLSGSDGSATTITIPDNDHTYTLSSLGIGNVKNYDQSKAIKSITRSGTTFTYTCLDNTTGTFTQQDNNTWTAFVGASSTADGTAGYVPAAGKGNQGKFFRGDGTWAVPTNTNTTYSIAQDSTDGHKFTLSGSDGSATTITIPDNNTTYSSKAAASGGTEVSLVTTGEKAIWNAKTTNTGTVTSVATGVGLTGGTITNSGTIKAKLKTETAATNDSADASNTSGRQYPVVQDKSGYLSVNVPWTDSKPVTSVAGKTGAVTLAKGDVGLGNVDNKSSATIRSEITSSNVTTALGFTPLNAALKGANSGVAELDASGKVPSSQLPSFVDDVLEYETTGDFPAAGEAGKIYVATGTNKTYRWSGSAYVEISASLALGETSSTAYRGDRGKTAYEHAAAKGSAFASGLYKITTNAQGHVTDAVAVEKSDITALGIPASNTTYTFDGTYNASTNKAATVSTVTNAINALDGGTIGEGGAGKTITALSQTNGNVSATFSDISITKSQVSDLGTIGAAAAKGVDTSIAAASTSTNLPTSKAVAAFVEGKGYKTTDNNTTYSLTQDETDGHKITLTPSSGTAQTITIPDNNTWRPVSDSVSSTSSSDAASSKAVKTAYDLAASKTANTGTVTKLSTGIGLTGGDVTTTGTVKAKLKSETAHTADSATPTNTANRQYAVGVDKSGYLSVNVPWTDTNNDTKNTAGSTDSSSKLFLIGATTQAANPQTYSHDTAYVGTDGCLYSGGTKVLTAHQDISGKANISDVPTKVSQLTNDSGFTTNTGTITGIKMNGTSKGTSGVVDLGTVLTSHQDISSKADKSATVSTVAYDSTNKKLTKTINGTTSDIVTVATLKTAMALNNVENKSSATIRDEITSSNVTTALGFTPLNATLKGANNGVAELDSAGKIPASQLPSYVDDVLEYDKQASFPETGETGTIYVAQDTNKTYRWSGTTYVEISPSLALGETSSTAYRGDRGKTAYDHAAAKGSAFSSGLYKITTNSEGHVTAATAVAKADITALGIPGSDTNTHRPIQVNGTEVLGSNTTALNLKAGSNVSVTNSSGTVTIAATDTTYSDATTSIHGLMSTADKAKVDGMGMVTYGTCSTAAGTAAKVITLSNANWQLKVGSIIAVKFTVTNTYSATTDAPITLNVNSTGAKSIWYNNAANPTGTNTGIFGYANRHIFFIYDGTYWVWMNMGALDGNSNTVPSAQCETAAGTAAKAATLTNYTLTANTWVHVNMRYANTYNGAITMNINNKGAKPIYINGAASSASNDTLPAGTYLVYYDGTNYQFRTDGKLPGSIAGDAATVGGHTVGVNVPSNAKFTDTTYSSKTAASGGTDVSLVTTGEKYTWNNKSNLTIGTTASTAAAGNHTHSTSIATSTGTNQITLAASTKYAITAGGTSYVFTTPPNTTYSAITNAEIDALFA